MGTLVLGRNLSRVPFTAGQLNVVGTFSDFLAIQFVNAEIQESLISSRLTERELEIARNIQRSLLLQELPEVPGLDRLVPDLGPLVARLRAAQANQYRIFRFDETGAIQACFVFLRMDAHLSAVPAETLALSQVVQSVLLWSDLAFRNRSPLAVAGQTTVLRPEIAALIRAAYDPVMPVVADDPSHALRLSARLAPVQ